MNILTRVSILVMAGAAFTGMAAPRGVAADAGYGQPGQPIRNLLASPAASDDGIAPLSRAQLRELSSVADSTDGSGDQRAAARAIIERSARNARLRQPAGASPHAAGLVADVRQELRAEGIGGVDPATLSLRDVHRLAQVFARQDGNHRRGAALAILEEASRNARLAQTVAEVPSAAARARSAAGQMAGLGIRLDDPGALTLGQLSRIASVLDQHDGDQAAAIRRILGL